MKPLSFILILISTLFLASCQVEKGTASGDLISGHTRVTNAFTVGVPGNASYAENEVLSFTLSHPFIVTVTGAPRLALNVGGSSVYADYVSGSGSKVLVFSYTVSPGDSDPDGISVTPTLDLNGGSIQFDLTDVNLSLTLPSTAGIKVDTTSPVMSGATPPPTGNYYTGELFSFVVTYNEPVVVTGAPSIDLTFNECTVAGNQTKKATYASGSGTNTLRFIYAVEDTCNEAIGGMTISTSIQLNGGAITDLAGNTAPVNFSAFISTPISTATQIRGRYPVLTNVTPPLQATYTPGSNLEFKLGFDRIVTANAATSYFNITIGTDSTKQVQYVSGTGSNELTYRYTVIGGDVDANGIDIASSLFNEGTICAGAYCLVNNRTDVIPANHYSGVNVSAPIPAITAIVPPTPLPASGYYKLGDTVQVVVRFSETVTVSGSPILSAVVGSTSRDMTYLSGSGTANLIFTYTIQDSDLDTDGVNFTSPLVLNAATIQNAHGTNADLDFTYTIIPGFRFDGVAPTILSSTISTVPATNHPDYRLGQYLYIDLTFSEAVTVSGSTLGLTIGGVARNASYNSSVSGTVKRYRYLVQAGDHTLNLPASLVVGTTLSAGTIRDVALNDISDRTVPATDTTGVKVDGAVPTVSSVDLPTDGTRYSGQTVSFTVNFSEPVNVTGTPTWVMTLDNGGPESVNYISGSGTSALLFRMTVDSDDLDLTGITLDTVFTLTGATITDVSVGNTLDNSIPVQTTAGIKLDGVGPTVSDITGPLASTYIENTNLDFTVTYSEAVTITGSPQLAVDIGGTTKYATYQSGSGSANIVYRYPVELGLNDKDGVEVTSHILNSGTITDLVGNSATLTISPYTFGTVLVDSQGPQILSITPPASGVKVSGNTLSFVVNFDENVTVGGGLPAPSFSLNIGGVAHPASYVAGSGSTALTFTTAALDATHFDPGGIEYSAGTLTLNSGTLKDIHNHDASLNFNTTDISGIKVIYSEVISWLDVSTFGGWDGDPILTLTDLSLAGNNAVWKSGNVTKIQFDPWLGNKASASFDGSSSLEMASLSVKTIVVAFRAGNIPVNAKLAASATKGIILLNQTDLFFGANARYAIDGGLLTGGVTSSCLSCYDSTSTNVITINFNTNQDIATILGEALQGGIAEVWVLSGGQNLSNAQIEKIGAYLNSKY